MSTWRQATGKAVDPGDNDDVPVAHRSEPLVELLAIGTCSAHLLSVYWLTIQTRELFKLSRKGSRSLRRKIKR